MARNKNARRTAAITGQPATVNAVPSLEQIKALADLVAKPVSVLPADKTVLTPKVILSKYAKKQIQLAQEADEPEDAEVGAGEAETIIKEYNDMIEAEKAAEETEQATARAFAKAAKKAENDKKAEAKKAEKLAEKAKKAEIKAEEPTSDPDVFGDGTKAWENISSYVDDPETQIVAPEGWGASEIQAAMGRVEPADTPLAEVGEITISFDFLDEISEFAEIARAEDELARVNAALVKRNTLVKERNALVGRRDDGVKVAAKAEAAAKKVVAQCNGNIALRIRLNVEDIWEAGAESPKFQEAVRRSSKIVGGKDLLDAAIEKQARAWLVQNNGDLLVVSAQADSDCEIAVAACEKAMDVFRSEIHDLNVKIDELNAEISPLWASASNIIRTIGKADPVSLLVARI